MRTCAVNGCANSDKKSRISGISFHAFPKDNRREPWLLFCGRNVDPTRAAICSVHFEQHCIEENLIWELLGRRPRRRLKSAAVPTLHAPGTGGESTRKRRRQQKKEKKKRKKMNVTMGVESSLLQAQQQTGEVLPTTEVVSSDLILARVQKENAMNVVVEKQQWLGVRRDLGVLHVQKHYQHDQRNIGYQQLNIRDITATVSTSATISLNRMHIMDEDCSNKPSALDDSPKTNGSPKTVAVDGEKEKDSDSGKENGGTGSSKCEQDSTSKKRDANQEGSEKVDEEKESAPDNEEDKTDESAELQIPVPVASSTPMTVKGGEAEKDNTNVESPNASGGEEGKQVVDNGAGGDEAARQEEKQDQQQDYLKGGNGGGDNCNLPLSPPEEEEDNSGASSPASQREEPKRCLERRKRDSSESDSDTPSVVKKMKMTNAEMEERERTVSEFVETAAGASLEEIQRHTEKLQQEIHTLNALARAKEHEWNNILRVRKIKEEMYIRLQRKRQVMLLMMGAAGKAGDPLDWDLMSDIRLGDFFGPEELPHDKNKVSAMNCKRVSKASFNKTNMKGHLHQQPSSTGSVPKGVRNHLPVAMVPAIPSGPCNLSTSSPVSSSSHLSPNTTLTRVPESSRDKLNGRTHRPILPKPTIIVPSGNGSNSSNNGQNPVIGEGRQGPILDVRSIIADYRSKHPGDVPRRGRRLKSALSPTPSCQVPENLVTSTRVSGAGGILSMASLALGSGSQMRPGLVGSSTTDMPDLGFLLNSTADSARQDSSRPSSADSSRSGAPSQVAHESGNHGTVGGISFKDVLVQFAKLSQNEQRHEPVPTTTAANKAPPYPEVTLHPVLAPNSPPSSSLLHGILTKSASMQQHRSDTNNARPTTFSPTLARLLTAPERMSGSIANTTTVTPFHGTAGPVSISDLLSTSKQTRNEITITPVAAQQPLKTKEEVVLLEEEQEDSADRLVIDESGEGGPRGDGDDDQSGAQDISADDVPECQGCHQRAAQFVCAGCGNQWYCSRDCQVSAWDDHSEVCSG